MAVNLAGYVLDQAGAAKVGLTIELWEAGGGAATSSTTTSAAGAWAFTGADITKTWRVKVIDGTKVLWIDGRSSFQVTEGDFITSLNVNTINEHTAANGVVIDGVTLKDGGITATAATSLSDDIALQLGGGAPAKLLWETADANANELILVLPEGDATDVPVFVIGDASILNVDLTWFNGVVEPTIAVVNDAADAYVSLDAGDDSIASAKGLYFKAAADEDIELLNLSVTGAPRIFWDESEDQFSSSKGWIFSAACDVQGTWVATAAWTLPAFTLGGAVTGGSQNMTGMGTINGLAITADTGAITTGTWTATVISPVYGGTGVANNLASTLTISGSFATTLTVSGITGVTLPTTGTLATLAGTEELDNKTLDSSVAKGTWTASGTWTIPAVTLGGLVSGGGQNLSNMGLINIGSATQYGRLNQGFEQNGVDNYCGVALNTWDNASSFGIVEFNTGGNGTIANYTAITTGNDIGAVSFRGADGTDWQQAARILCSVTGTVGNNRVPGLLKFLLMSDAASSVETNAMQVTAATGTGIQFGTYGAGTITADASGNLTSVSDERLKNISGKFTRGLHSILGLSPINFYWKKDSGMEHEHEYTGFTSQNVESVIPEAIGKQANGYLTLSDRPILAAIVNAIKEMDARLQTVGA